MMANARRFLYAALPPLVLLVVVLAAWDAATVLFDIKRYLLPRPAQVWEAAWQQKRDLLSAAALTGQAAVCGFAGSFLIGLLVACVFSQSRVVARSVYPYAIFLQTVPIVGIAPLIVVWFGYGFQSVVVVALVISLFPIITSGTTGLTTIDKNLMELFELASASRWQVLIKLRLPNAVPYLVTGAKTSAGLAVVGAIVGEIFAGSAMERQGLGTLIEQTRGHLKTDYLVAAILTSTLLGTAVFGSIHVLGAAVLKRWHSDKQPGS